MARVVRQERGVFHVALDSYAELEPLLAALRAEGIAIDELAFEETDLEQVFLKIMQRAGGPRERDVSTPVPQEALALRPTSRGWLTLFHKEVLRFWKVRFQTIAAPILTVAPVSPHLLARARRPRVGVRRPRDATRRSWCPAS